MNNAIFDKVIRNLRNRIDVRFVNNGKDYLKCTSTPSHMSHTIFVNNLVAIRKSKVGYKAISILRLKTVLKINIFQVCVQSDKIP